jgi:hypothetical protein
MIVTAPSGLAGEVRSLKIRELKQLADPALARGGRNLDLMLSMFSAITDPGPYSWAVGDKPQFGRMLLGDRFSLLIDIRCMTWGPEYVFPIRCSDPSGLCENTRKGFEWELDLRDLPRRPYAPETIAKLKEGANRFETVGPNGEAVVFRLLYGEDERTIEAYRRRHDGRWTIAEALAQKIVSVDGVKDNPAAITAWVEELDAGAGLELSNRMDVVDGGVETTIEIVCPACRWEESISLPFVKAFFGPSKSKKTSSGTETASPSLAADPTPTALSSDSKAKKTG